MAKQQPATQPIRRSIQQAVTLAILYVVLVVVLPASQAGRQAYHLSALEYRIILLAIALPSLLTWLAAFYGFAALRQYVHVIRKSREGDSFDGLATGSAWLAWSLPVTMLLGLIAGALSDQWSGLYTAASIILNYVNLLVPLVGFTIISSASRTLVNQARLHFSVSSIRSIMLVFLSAGVLYCYLIFRHLDLKSLTSTHNVYLLPVWLVVISIIMPYLYAWFAGLLAAYEITLVSKHTKGILYRQALQLLVAGLVAIIIGFILTQYITTASPSPGYLVLNYRLILLTVFRLIYGAGFLLLAFGALRLKRIEEV